jgi:hypothetical protein
MKNSKVFIRLALVAAAAFSIMACGGDKVERKVASQGKEYEILVVCNEPKWQGELGDTLRAVLSEEVPVLNQREPIFSIQRIVPNSFTGLITKHRNIINVSTGDKFKEPRMTAEYDVYSAPQLIVNLTGPDDASLTAYVWENRQYLQSIFNMAERDRMLAHNARFGDKTIEKNIKEKFDMTINIPKGYKMRDNKPPHFMWLSMEYPQASQGVVIYSYPYTDKNNFTVDSLLARRNQFTALIPAENPGSHMTTYGEFVPELKHIRIGGRYWAEMRGFWDAEKDFMGGPFVSYSTLDTKTNMVVTLDFYVYSPSPYKPKRNYLRGLENLIYSVAFPGDEAPQDGGTLPPIYVDATKEAQQ